MKNNKIYSFEEGIKKVKKNAKAKFDESVEVHIRAGIDPKKGEQQVRATCVLPHGTGKTKRIAVFTENEKEVKEAGADIIGGKDLIQEIKDKGVINFDIAVATPGIMKELAQIAKILGPKGLMPSPKNETVTKDVAKTIKELKGGKVAFKNDETSNIHQIIGKVSWDENKLKENYEAFMQAVNKAKPSGVKGIYIKAVTICSSMGKGIRIKV
ncbi:50S ribosomal protein L1 [Patescibacteria group bacterium]|nr:50S ribosomal protein L1 [Patescibacteria group bacterium]